RQRTDTVTVSRTTLEWQQALAANDASGSGAAVSDERTLRAGEAGPAEHAGAPRTSRHVSGGSLTPACAAVRQCGDMLASRRVLEPSTCGRFLAWFMLIVAVALGLNLLVVDQFLHNRARSNAETELEHEVVKFHKFSSRGIDPNTGQHFDNAESLIHSYLDNAVPEQDESLFEIVDGRVKHRSRSTVPARLDQQRDVVRRAATATRTEKHETQANGDTVVYAAIPVRVEGDSSDTTVVIVESLAAD